MLNAPQSDTEFGANDLMFAQMMIPHHEQAIEMSLLAPGRAENPLILELASEILAEQDPEIEIMQSWLTEAGVGLQMDHQMPMSGMLSEADLEQLRAATGAEFEKLFLTGMIAHHEGAIQMAAMVVTSANDQARALGESIIKSQRLQITYMQELLGSY